MARLTFGILTPKMDMPITDLNRLITDGKMRSDYLFPDTSFITTRLQERFWLLRSSAVLTFPEMTVAELSGWLRSPIHNEYLHNWLPRALDKCRTEPYVDGPLHQSHVLGLVGGLLHPFNVAILRYREMQQYGFEYYVNRLSVRKRLGIRVGRNLQAAIGRPPTESEVKKWVHENHHPRAATLAAKGWTDKGKRNYTADEEIVVSAFINAIMTGRTTTILTWDNDVFEQFAKMAEVITSDYMCWRFGLVHHANPTENPLYSLNLTTTEMQNLGLRGTTVEHLIIPEEEAERMPPTEFTPVHCFCVLVGNTCYEPKVSIAGYCLEREMEYLLRTKAATGGKNSEHFGNRNIQIGHDAKDGTRRLFFALGEEVMIDYEGITISQIDLTHTLRDKVAIVEKFWLTPALVQLRRM